MTVIKKLLQVNNNNPTTGRLAEYYKARGVVLPTIGSTILSRFMGDYRRGFG
jgi:hypothetical protein